MLSYFTGDESSCPAQMWISGALEPKANVILGAVDIVRIPGGTKPCTESIEAIFTQGPAHRVWYVHIPAPRPAPMALFPA